VFGGDRQDAVAQFFPQRLEGGMGNGQASRPHDPFNGYSVADDEHTRIARHDVDQTGVVFDLQQGRLENRTGRVYCEECPISGTIWYDDFRLTKL
jgi:hypothetical protein